MPNHSIDPHIQKGIEMAKVFIALVVGFFVALVVLAFAYLTKRKITSSKVVSTVVSCMLINVVWQFSHTAVWIIILLEFVALVVCKIIDIINEHEASDPIDYVSGVNKASDLINECVAADNNEQSEKPKARVTIYGNNNIIRIIPNEPEK